MKKHKTVLILALALILLLGGASILYGSLGQKAAPDRLSAQDSTQAEQDAAPEQTAEPEQDAEPEQTSEPEKVLAPDFTVYDREGGEVHLSDFIGKPVVLNFWASWCGPCQSEMPDFDEAYAELGGNVHFLMVNMTTSSRESFEKAAAFIDEKGYAFPVFYDTDSDVATVYGVYSLPTTIFIDAEGYAIAQAIGAIDRATLQKGLAMIA